MTAFATVPDAFNLVGVGSNPITGILFLVAGGVLFVMIVVGIRRWWKTPEEDDRPRPFGWDPGYAPLETEQNPGQPGAGPAGQSGPAGGRYDLPAPSNGDVDWNDPRLQGPGSSAGGATPPPYQPPVEGDGSGSRPGDAPR